MNKGKCQNCGKERILKEIFIALDNVYENWCKICRRNYEKDSKLVRIYKLNNNK